MTDQSQLTEADVKRMYANREYQQIEDARIAGRLNDLLAGVDQEDNAS